MKEFFRIFFKGFAVGVANIIPGVSGGTMALILGIYERCLAAISAIKLDTIKKICGIFSKNEKLRLEAREELKRLDIVFLLMLALGAVLAVFTLAKVMSILLTRWHDPTYGFFFGLVLASVLVPWKLVKKVTASVIIMAVVGAGIGVGTDFLMSKEDQISNAESKVAIAQLKEERNKLQLQGESEALAAVEKQLAEMSSSDGSTMYYAKLVAAGAIAISAMILPGISGSFLLLAMGLYFDILTAISTFNILVILLFGLGCIIGLLAFTKLLNWLLKKAADPTMGFLTGLMVGSLWSIWPFKESYTTGIGTNYVTLLYLGNRWPDSFAGNEFAVIVTMILGIALVGGFLYFEKTHQKVEQ